MNTISAVLVGHLIGDWIAQTDWQAANKMTSWRANQQHVLSYHVALAAALVSTSMSLRSIAVVLVLSWLTHSFIDRRWPVVWLMQHTGSRPFSQTLFGVIAVDQALHLSLLLVLAGLS